MNVSSIPALSTAADRPLRVLIAGAGLGGLCLAQGLVKDGHDVYVFERDAEIVQRSGYMLSINGDDDGVASLLGTGFALRLARNLARELGGELAMAADSLTLRLPAAASGQIGHTGL